jgi:hypothetical protein
MSVAKVRPRKGGWGIVTDIVMLNVGMSSDARFLIAMCATLAPNWKFSISWLMAKSGWGRQKLQKVMRELEEHNHLVRIRFHNGLGLEWEYEFILDPQEVENQPIAQQEHENKPIAQGDDFQPIEKQSIENRSIKQKKSSTRGSGNMEKGDARGRRRRKEQMSKPPDEWLGGYMSEKEKEYLETK